MTQIRHESEPKVKPLSVLRINKVAIEVYRQVDAMQLEADALIATIARKGKWAARISSPFNTFLRLQAGEHYHEQLKKVTDFQPLTAVLIPGDGKQELPPFKSVIFVNGLTPMAEVIAQALKTADDEGCQTVILPVMAFTTAHTPYGDTMLRQEVAGEFQLAVECLNLRTVKTIKLVYPS